ncbi:MAG: hypothetical protein HZA63_14455 [Rhodocyclales bacterium]|nr:hypothetical protein [Rhodocyclales bacterium]
MATRGIYKVIPAGVTDSGRLRATLMLSPEVATSGDLGTLPSWLVTDWLDAKRGLMPLRIHSVWVTDGTCAVPDAKALANSPTCVAHAFSLKQAWGAKDDLSWLDALWTDSLVGSAERPDEVWATLDALLRASNAGTGLQAGSGLCSAQETAATPAPASSTSTQVQTIVPSRQSDLALLLESERALEVCATVRWAHGDAASCHAEEEACCRALEQGALQPAASADAVIDPTDGDQAKLRAQARARYEAATCSVLGLYTCTPDPAPQPALASWLVDPAALASGREAVSKAIPAAVRSHRDANRVEASKPDPAPDKSRVAQRYFAIQGSPALSRLFGLTVDLEIDAKALNDTLGLSPAQCANQATVVHMLIGVDTAHGGERPVFTLARYRPAGTGHFMPASRLELHWADRQSFHPQASQYEGVLVLGQELETDTGKRLGRFLMTTLDVPRATNGASDRIGVTPTQKPNERLQAEEKARRDRTTLADWKPTGKDLEPLLARKPAGWARKTNSTAGLVLLDRGRAEQSLQQFAARSVHNHRPDCILLDSNDLLMGYRLDVGVPIGSRGDCDFAWRSLMARDIRHGNGGPYAPEVARKVPLLMGGSTHRVSAWQRTLDDAQLGLPARLVDSADPATASGKDAYVEEVIAVWTGEPMAALCAAAEGNKERDAEVGAGELVTLPTAGGSDDRVPPPLRFGWPYRLGVRAVYAGGISLALADAKPLYDGAIDCAAASRLALPARGAGASSGVRRFLRHERIAAPFLLMHADIALRSSGKMGYERSAHAIVRSTLGEASANFGEPGQTRRIFVPPSVEMHFAALHGVFDANGPVQGLRHVRFDAERGGFPCVTARSVEGINGESFHGDRSISTRSDDRGDAVYIEKAAARPHPYYPDPAASRWAVAVRYADTNCYLEGDAITVPIRRGIERYPDCAPLVVRVVRDTSPREASAPPRLPQVVSIAPGVSSHARGGVELVVSLAPGEDFEVDVWCLPDADLLQEAFASVEAIGTVALLRADAKDPKTEEQRWAGLLDALEAMLPKAFIDTLRKKLGAWPLQRVWPLNDGIAGLPTPGRDIREAIGAALFETLCMRPLAEIAAVQSLRVTHVSAQPARQPSFETGIPGKGLAARRGQQVPAVPVAAKGVAVPAASDRVDYLLTGSVRADLVSTGAIEFRARATCPTTSAFDDPRRGRGARDRRNGTWPRSGQAELSAEAVFGFDVSSDGRVTLPMREITLLQVEDLEQPTPTRPAAAADGLWRLDMERLTDDRSGSYWGRVAARHVFPDRKARRLRVRMIARTRHEELMRTASGTARFGEWLEPGQDPRAAKDPGDGSAVEIWLPAGIRPSEPVAMTPIPAFEWEDLGTTVVRRTVIRIPLGRGWFSSGEGERLGVVVWPPGALDGVATVPRLGNATWRGSRPPLPDFIDEDLGPGGKFVTRWGSDPTRPVDRKARVDPRLPGFLDPSAFRDVSTNSAERFNVALVSEVAMPVRRDAATADADVGNEANPQVTMAVSLVTYEPLFDVETEQWFVDIALDHAFEAQPFVRLGLVRYQPHAPEALQVSFPTVQWVQLLPQRSAWMFTEEVGRKKTTWLAVEGLGPVDVSRDAGDRSVGTRMVARVVTDYTNAAGLPCRHVGPVLSMTAEPSGDGPPGSGPYHGPRWRWTRQIAIDDDIEATSADLPGATHYLYIEEREAYLPATYANEPVSADVAAGLVSSCDQAESGPRFAVRLPLRRPKPLAKR